jgi:thiamine-monophosphate kinase
MLKSQRMKLSELGEFGIIDLIHGINSRLADKRQHSWQNLILGIGDDAAAWRGNSHIQLATTDSLVQNTHFHLDNISWKELGWKSLAVNLSDIAAMGGIPQYAFVSLALPADLTTENIADFYEGMVLLATEFGVSIAGGNLASAPYSIITVTVTGYSEHDEILKRSTARAGEQIAVTGHPGLAAAGLQISNDKNKLSPEAIKIFRHRQCKPVPRVHEGQVLLNQGVKTAIDISDGLIADLYHICEASNVNVKVYLEQIPIHPLLKASFTEYENMALYGGEDYELLFTAKREVIQQLIQIIDCPITIIGDIVDERVPAQVVLIDSKGRNLPCDRHGWEHFRDGRFKPEIR